MNNKVVIGIIALVVVVVGGYFLLGTSNDSLINDSQLTIAQKTSNNSANGDSIRDSATSEKQEGNPSNYRVFDTNQFEEAKSQGKTTMLYFTANWCPTCKTQIPVNKEAFRELEEDDDIIVFEAHILDSETTETTEDLAKEYGVRLQHTFIIINPSGEVVFTHTGPLTKEDIVSNLLSAKS